MRVHVWRDMSSRHNKFIESEAMDEILVSFIFYNLLDLIVINQRFEEDSIKEGELMESLRNVIYSWLCWNFKKDVEDFFNEFAKLGKIIMK
jgi:hypothetical protein